MVQLVGLDIIGCATTVRVATFPVRVAAQGVAEAATLATKGVVGAGKGVAHVVTPPFRGQEVVGEASWYGRAHHGKRTASGEVYDMYKLTAAHRSLPHGTKVKVTNLQNGRTVVVKINDRGPASKRRIIDLSFAAAKEIGLSGGGRGRVQLMVLD
ncbi:MAG: septal ring lytic transglycosylase RlpA family protein [Candidatus Tectomicrobia bacterium]|nr:septal ring lytic transglycosylase RlpA family protein [Candidatus Tectomicrobia bacterium]